MKRLLLPFLLIILAHASFGQSIYFPPTTGNQWDSISPASLNWCQPEIDTLLAYLEKENTKGFMILKDGKIVIEEYMNSFGPDSAWIWYSAGKSLTALLTGIAQQEGHLDINDKTSDYLGRGWTSLDTTKEDLITIRDQLMMTSGLDDQATTYCTLDTCLKYKADAGTRWVYHNPPYSLLRDVLENATGNNYNVYTWQKLNGPIGFDGFWLPVGYNNFYFSTTRAMARFGLLMLNEGIWDQDTILRDTTYFREMVNTSQNLNLSYGYLWWLNGKNSYIPPGITTPIPGFIAPDAPADMYAAAGAQGQFICIVPSMDLVVVRNGNDSSSLPVPTLFLNEIWKRIMAIFCNTTGIPENESFDLNVYPNPATNSIVITGMSDVVQVDVSDISGRSVPVILEGNSIQLPQSIKTGVYFLRVYTSNGSAVKRFIVK